jgi:hypothetical protein
MLQEYKRTGGFFMLLEALKDNFTRVDPTISANILIVTEAMMRCGSSNSSDVVRELNKLKNNNFKTSDMWLYRLLDHKNFQIDDNFWRCYIKSIFKILFEQGEISKKGDKIVIAIDFTSDKDDFLILCASLIINNLTIPIYFSMRNYPKRKNQYDQKKMELAFIKALKHILSDKYKYIFIADRGFGNERFIGNCLQESFDIMVRIEPNMNIKINGKQGIASKILTEDGVYPCYIEAWKKNYTIIRHSKDDKIWYILTNLSNSKALEVAEIYKKRFRIEKLFQNLKSSGFDIEKSKIKKYDRFKRMLFLSCFAHSMLVLIGKFVDEKLPNFKKNSPIFTNLLIASSNLATLPLPTTKNKRIKS